MSKYDPTFDNKLVLRPCDLISWLSDFVIYLNTYFILYSENQCISKLDKIGIFIDMKFH